MPDPALISPLDTRECANNIVRTHLTGQSGAKDSETTTGQGVGWVAQADLSTCNTLPRRRRARSVAALRDQKVQATGQAIIVPNQTYVVAHPENNILGDGRWHVGTGLLHKADEISARAVDNSPGWDRTAFAWVRDQIGRILSESRSGEQRQTCRCA